MLSVMRTHRFFTDVYAWYKNERVGKSTLIFESRKNIKDISVILHVKVYRINTPSPSVQKQYTVRVTSDKSIIHLIDLVISEVYYQIKAKTLNKECDFVSPETYSFFIEIKEDRQGFYIVGTIISEFLEMDEINHDETGDADESIKDAVETLDECMRKNELFHNDLWDPRNPLSRLLNHGNVKLIKKTDKIAILDFGSAHDDERVARGGNRSVRKTCHRKTCHRKTCHRKTCHRKT